MQETLDALADLYKALNEMDMWSAVWNKRAFYPETLKALSFSQHGNFVLAQEALEQQMASQQTALTSGLNLYGLTLTIMPEVRLWEEEWMRSGIFFCIILIEKRSVVRLLVWIGNVL